MPSKVYSISQAAGALNNSLAALERLTKVDAATSWSGTINPALEDIKYSEDEMKNFSAFKRILNELKVIETTCGDKAGVKSSLTECRKSFDRYKTTLGLQRVRSKYNVLVVYAIERLQKTKTIEDICNRPESKLDITSADLTTLNHRVDGIVTLLSSFSKVPNNKTSDMKKSKMQFNFWERFKHMNKGQQRINPTKPEELVKEEMSRLRTITVKIRPALMIWRGTRTVERKKTSVGTKEAMLSALKPTNQPREPKVRYPRTRREK